MRGSPQQTHHLSTGPASWAARGSSYAMPYIDSSGLGGEYNMGRDQASRSNYSFSEEAMLRRGSGCGSQQDHFQGRMQNREPPSSSRASLNLSHGLDPSLMQSKQKIDQNLVHSAMDYVCDLDRERRCSSPLPVQRVMDSRSAIISPLANTIHQAPSLSHVEQNGYALPLFNDGRCSPLPSKSSRLQKLQKVHHNSDADPHKGASSPGQESHPVLSRAERMAALERRMMANGLSTPGRSRASLGQKRLRQAGATHVGAVQMNDGCTTSGSESSESEVENRGNCSSPLIFDNPVEANSPIPRNKFSFGSLQLDEEADEDGCYAFSDEDGGPIFSC